jgi:predicted membrane protein
MNDMNYNLKKKNQATFDTRFFTGSILVAIGLILIAVNLNLLSYEMSHVLISWPMLLVVIGLFNLARRAHTPGYVFIALGLFFLTPRILDVPENFYRNFWPALLIVIGIIFMVQRQSVSRHQRWMNPEASASDPESTTGNSVFNTASEPYSSSSSDYIDETAILGGRNFSMVSDHFVGGKITAVFGGFAINLSNCKPAQGCTLDIVNVFGGTKLIVPPDWNVKMEVTAIAGGFEDKRKNLSREIDPAKTIVIKGTCIFGGGEIISFL